jgi:hypothetical protein
MVTGGVKVSLMGGTSSVVSPVVGKKVAPVIPTKIGRGVGPVRIPGPLNSSLLNSPF